MSRRMALFRLQYARERLIAARVLLGSRLHHDSAIRSYISGTYSIWAYLELQEIPCFHSSEVPTVFQQSVGGRSPEGKKISCRLGDLLEADREERVGDFFQADALAAAHHYRNAEAIFLEVEKAFKARGIKL